MSRLALLSGLAAALVAGLSASPPPVAAATAELRPVASSCAATPCVGQAAARQ